MAPIHSTPDAIIVVYRVLSSYETKPFNYYNGAFEKQHFVKNGDLLFSWSGTPGTSFGAFFWNRGDAVLNQHIFNVKFDKEKVYDGFLKIALNSKLAYIINQSHGGVGLKHITKGKLEAVQIPVPPIGDQIRIATVLTRAENLIAKRKESIKALDEFLKSTFLEMFGDPVRNEKNWEHKLISDLCEEIVDCVNKTAPQSEEETSYVMIRTSNVRDGKINLDKVKYVSEAVYSIWTRRSIPQKGDLLFTREAPMGEVGLVEAGAKIFLGQRIMQYRCNSSSLNPIYLLHLMQTSFFKKQIDRLGKGSTVKHLSVPDCFKFRIPQPLIKLQNKFAAVVEKVESLKSNYTQSLTDLETLYSSLSQRAFKGELDLSRVPLEGR